MYTIESIVNMVFVKCFAQLCDRNMNALVLLALVVCLTFADTVLSDGTTFCATSGLNVREGPCTDKKIVITIAQGAQVVHTGQTSNACGYTWYQIQAQGKSGWAGMNTKK